MFRISVNLSPSMPLRNSSSAKAERHEQNLLTQESHDFFISQRPLSSRSDLPHFSGELHKAAKRNDTKGIQKYLKPLNTNVDDFDEEGMTALQHACKKGHQEAVIFLITKGADPDLPSRKGKTSVQYAQEKFQAHIVRLLTQTYGVTAPTDTFPIVEEEEQF